jgi:iron-sulfur cluster assembly accessory protein
MDSTVNITERAANRICEIAANEQAKALRVSVNGGGCSGFHYDFAMTNDVGADDLVVERDGARVLIDSISLAYMSGATLDYVDDLIGQAFKIQNPLAKSSCGCGTSFSI